jgi:hypothetical protein
MGLIPLIKGCFFGQMVAYLDRARDARPHKARQARVMGDERPRDI